MFLFLKKKFDSNPGTPKKEDKTKQKPKDSFQDFEIKTSDAWDDGDDDLILMANIQMSLKDVQSTARAVLDKHSRQRQQQNGAREEAAATSNTATTTSSPLTLSGNFLKFFVFG